MTSETSEKTSGQGSKKAWTQPKAVTVPARNAENSTVDPTRTDGPRCHS